ncbi:kinase-like domain-containing protein [Aspergillus multicolor]|uniref:kinase-like domain-containing protein n=1 Tax=Aspergillus multicolor TaxID=41759 RepID=UPI003CCD3C1A
MDRLPETNGSQPRRSTTYPGRPSLRDRGSSLTVSDGALRELQKALDNLEVDSSEAHLAFIPQRHLQRLVEDYARDVLDERWEADTEQITRYSLTISERAVKLFAILVDMKRELDIIRFLDEGIDDECLPFLRGPGYTASPVLLTKQNRSIQTLRHWIPQDIKKLQKQQYRVLSPVFRSGEHYDLDEFYILPFIELEEHTGGGEIPVAGGGYGKVTREYIHPDHLDSGIQSTQEAMVVAVKRMFYSADFKLERKVYGDLGPSNRHDHLINLLFSFTKKDCHLVFPWADGSLKNYWEIHPIPDYSRELLLWSVGQMAGIASGLASFHEFTDPRHGLTRFGRHGDIKAANILWFRDPNILKIADLGLASVRGRDSRSNVNPKSVVDSPTYSPPEIQRGHAISRKWDIWSLGCLYLEFITYLVLGWPAIAEFVAVRHERDSLYPELFTDEFYTTDYNSVKPAVLAWVKHLKRQARCSSLIHDILDLVMDKMILIDPNARMTSADVCKTLEDMLDRAKENDRYLLEHRSGVRIVPDYPALQPVRRPPSGFNGGSL